MFKPQNTRPRSLKEEASLFLLDRIWMGKWRERERGASVCWRGKEGGKEREREWWGMNHHSG